LRGDRVSHDRLDFSKVQPQAAIAKIAALVFLQGEREALSPQSHRDTEKISGLFWFFFSVFSVSEPALSEAEG
jgi:hypothetical protein